MPHVQGHGGDFGAQYSQQIADTASKIRGLENTKTFQQIVNEAANQQLQNIQNQQGQPGFETTLLDDQGKGQITADFGKRGGKFNDIRDKLNTEGYGALNEQEKSIANFYLGITGGKGSVQTNFEKAIDDFIKFEPGGVEAYKADQGLLGGLNVAMTNLPEAIAEKTLLGNIISATLNKGRNVADFAGGLFPGAGATFQGIGEDLAAAPAGIKEDFTTMLGINKDDNPVKSVLRDELDIKKNTSNDISPDTFMQAEDRNLGIANANLTGGTPISQAFSGDITTGVDLSRFIDPNTSRVPAELTLDGQERTVQDKFQGLNLGQLQNLIRDETGYFDRVIQQLGLGGR